MSCFNDLIRPFWLPGLNSISGKVPFSIRNWIGKKEFQIYQELTKRNFSLSLSETTPLISAFAFDHNKLSIAAFETICHIEKNHSFPKSFSWTFIKIYYAAYYSAHAILRLMGTSLTYLGTREASIINSIGSLFGYSAEKVQAGYYECVFDFDNKEFLGKKLEPSGGGSHELLWKTFYGIINDISERVLIGPGLTIDKQKVSIILSDICDNLAYGPCGNNKNWLSTIRNGITYRHEFSVWFPYKNQPRYYNQFYDSILLWKRDLMDFSFYKQHGRDLQRFVETCCALISMLRTLDIDMANRCPKGKSFLEFGPISFLNKANIEN